MGRLLGGWSVQTHFIPRPVPFQLWLIRAVSSNLMPTVCVGCKTIFVPVVTFTSHWLWAACSILLWHPHLCSSLLPMRVIRGSGGGLKTLKPVAFHSDPLTYKKFLFWLLPLHKQHQAPPNHRLHRAILCHRIMQHNIYRHYLIWGPAQCESHMHELVRHLGHLTTATPLTPHAELWLNSFKFSCNLA